MKLRCLVRRHRPAATIFNQGVYFSTCQHCGVALIRPRGADWQTVPRGFRVTWRAQGSHSLPPVKGMNRRHRPGAIADELRNVARVLGRRHSDAGDEGQHIRLVL
jgi:hypothetical protein